jgi:hypothetical protein
LRSLHALLHGQWGESWQYHPFPLLGLGALAVTGAAWAAERFRGASPWTRLLRHPAWLWVGTLAWLVWAACRNVI